jgi:hypothetical protein
MAEKTVRYYIVNPQGAVHEVSREMAKARLALAGWREPTKAELKAYKDTKIQRSGEPIAKPWTPEPGQTPEPEGVEE